MAAMVLTGTTGTAQALGPDDIDPTAVGALRLLVGGPALLAISARHLRGRRLPWRPMAVAAVAMAVYQPFFFGGTARAVACPPASGPLRPLWPSWEWSW